MQEQSIKWKVLFGGFFSYMFDAMDIMLLALSIPAIMKELNISMSEAGLLGTATLIGVGLSSIIVGWYADNYGRRKALLWSLISFGILTAFIGLASSWLQILILRFLAGLGLGGVWGIAAAYIAETWPINQRGRAAAFVLSSFPVGAGIASFLAAVILPSYGWRVLFFTGSASILAALYVYICVPESKAWKEERAARLSKKDEPENVSISEIFAPELLKTTILATVVSSCAFIAYWGSTTWLPTFLVKEKGLSMETMAMFMLILNVGMFFGYNLFGYLADKLGRKKALIISFVGTTVTLPIYVMATDKTMILWLGPAYAFFITFAGLFGSYFAELFPTRIRTLGAGFCFNIGRGVSCPTHNANTPGAAFCFNIGRGVSAFAPFLLGAVAAKYSLSTGIIICAVFFLLAGLAMVFLPETQKK